MVVTVDCAKSHCFAVTFIVPLGGSFGKDSINRNETEGTRKIYKELRMNKLQLLNILSTHN